MLVILHENSKGTYYYYYYYKKKKDYGMALLRLNIYRLPFLKATNEVHVQTRGKEFLLPNDSTSHLMNHVNLKNCKQELQPVVSPQSELKSTKS